MQVAVLLSRHEVEMSNANSLHASV